MACYREVQRTAGDSFFCFKVGHNQCFSLIEKGSEEPILIGARSFERKNLDFMAFEGRTYAFSN